LLVGRQTLELNAACVTAGLTDGPSTYYLELEVIALTLEQNAAYFMVFR
jgi:hypothetical protein